MVMPNKPVLPHIFLKRFVVLEILLCLIASTSLAQDLTITSPADGECVTSQYTVDAPFEGGIVNGNNFPPEQATITINYEDDTGHMLEVEYTTSTVSPSFPQPPQTLCPDWDFGEDQYEACGGQGYCVFDFGVRKCICFEDSDCSDGNGGSGVCRPDGVCGCSDDQQCGVGQVCKLCTADVCNCDNDSTCNTGQTCLPSGVCSCSADSDCGDGLICSNGACSVSDAGSCQCADDSACSAGQTCLPSGVCSCATADDCGDGLVCSNGVCSEINEGETNSEFIDQAEEGEALPRTIVKELNLPPDLEDSPDLAVQVSIRDFMLPFEESVVASTQIGFQLDRSYPLLNTTDSCEDDTYCTEPGEVCDLFTNRCFPQEIANIGRCRPNEDFSAGLGADYELVDNIDTAPQYTVLGNLVEGCRTTQSILVQDSCGNAQMITIANERAPVEGEVTASIVGYSCTTSPCGTDSVIGEGTTGSRLNIGYDLNAPEGCYDVAKLHLDPVNEANLSIPCEVDNLGADNCDAGYRCLNDAGDACPLGQSCQCSRALFGDEILQALPADILSSRSVTASNGAEFISHTGPFQLTAGEQLTFTLADGSVETVTINEEDYFNLQEVLAIEVVIAINGQASNVVAYVDDTALHIRTRELGQGVTLSVAGNAADNLGFTEAFDSAYAEGSGDGNFRARLAVYACGNELPLVTDLFAFSISMPFELTLNGPYIVDEGSDLLIDVSSAFVSPELGGIAKVEWDLDGDGVYEREQSFDPAVTSLPDEPADPEEAETNLTVVKIDTEDQAEFNVSIRLTTGQGETIEARDRVVINDLAPTCVLSQAEFNLREGAPFVFTAPDTTGHPSDEIVSYQWDFAGEDQSNNDQVITSTPSLQYTFDEAGDYTVTLTAFDEDDSPCNPAATSTITVGGVTPVIGEDIGIAEVSEEPVEGRPVTFTAGSTQAGAATDPITNYTWTYGYNIDGELVGVSGEDIVEPQHVFQDDGNYEICLSVEDSNDLVGPSCFTITVADLKPTVIWDGPIQGIEGQPLTFDSAGTVAGGAADPISSLRWDFSDNGEPQFEETATHTFSGDGVFVVRLTAFDEDLDDAGNFFEREVTIADVSPIARFAIIYPDPELEVGIEGQPVVLNAEASEAGAPSDPIRWYHWDFGDGSDSLRTAEPVVQHSWPDGPADYTIELTVEDEDGSTNSTTLNISIANQDPEVSISASNSSAEVGSSVTFTLNVEDVSGDRPGTSDQDVVIEWDLGDGTLITDQTVVEHTYEREGPFNISVLFRDGDGGEAQAAYQFTSTPRLAEVSDPVVTVIDDLDGEVSDPSLPIGEFSGDDAEEAVYYMREGQEITLSLQITSSTLSNGTLDVASARWFPIPDSAQPNYVPVDPPAGDPDEGDAVKHATVTWRPNFFQSGTWQFQLSVEGESTGSSLTRNFVVHVIDRGTPMLAATSGSLRRGRVVLYRYDFNNGSISFTPNREVNVGLGAYDIVPDLDRRRVFVSSPLSGHVAVVGGEPASVLRFIKTGAGAYDMDLGGGSLWVVNVEDKSLSAIDPDTLKIRKTAPIPGAELPISVLWVGDDQGLARGRVLIGDGRTGELIVVNTQGFLAGEGEAAVEARVPFGGSINQLIARDGVLWAANGKKRRIYKLDLEDLMVRGDGATIEEITDIPFAITDMVATDRGLWVATGDQLTLIDPDGFLEGYEIPAQRLIEAHPLVIGGSGLTISTGLRIDNFLLNLDGDLQSVVGLEGSPAQRLASFIQYVD